MTQLPEKHRVVVTIEPPEEIVDRARQRAGADGDLEAHLLDGCLFEYQWAGVNESREE